LKELLSSFGESCDLYIQSWDVLIASCCFQALISAES